MIETTREHLVVMDMQDYFLRDKPSEQVASVITEINHIIHSFRELQLPITFCVYDPLYFGHTSEAIDCRDGDIIFPKSENDAFSSDVFKQRVLQSNRLIITGCNLEFCVRETADHASRLGLKVVIPKNAVLSRDVFSLRKLRTQLHFMLKGIRFVAHQEM